MPRQRTDDELIGLVFADPARRRVAIRYKVPSGSLKLLVAVDMLRRLGHTPTPRKVYELGLMREDLARTYALILRKAGLLDRNARRGRRVTLTLSGNGLLCLGALDREINTLAEAADARSRN